MWCVDTWLKRTQRGGEVQHHTQDHVYARILSAYGRKEVSDRTRPLSYAWGKTFGEPSAGGGASDGQGGTTRRSLRRCVTGAGVPIGLRLS